MRHVTILFIAFFLAVLKAQDAEGGQKRPNPATVQQWQSRKYGMFIHFGLFSELGGVWKGQQYSGNYSEQIQSDARIPEAEYARIAASFRPAKWNPDAIVQLAIDAGMKFIVLTSKHHDGFSMFGTRQSAYNVVEATPYKRDIVKSLAEACARRHMPFGLYYSTIDWHFGDVPQRANDNPISQAHEAFNVAQIRELMTGYGPISEIWFDMGHPTKLQSRHFADTVHAYQAECMINGRIWNNEGDFSETGDDAIPDYILDEPWESPASIYSETWGYRSWQKRGDAGEKTREHLLRLVKVVSRGGNYILNIGPRGDGSVVEFEADVLRGVGQWLKRNGEAIYETQAQPFRKLDFGYATRKGHRLYLFVEHTPERGRLVLPGLQNRIRRAFVLGDDGRQLRIDNDAGAKTVTLTGSQEFLPVVVVEFDDQLNVEQPAVRPDTNHTIRLEPGTADVFYNANGEGYYDPPTLRKQQWHFAVDQAGVYELKVMYKPGKFSRLVDVSVAGGETVKANLHGDEREAAAGVFQLNASKDLLLTIEPGSPAERAATLDVTIERILLEYKGARK